MQKNFLAKILFGWTLIFAAGVLIINFFIANVSGMYEGPPADPGENIIGDRLFPSGSQCPHPEYNGQPAHNITGWMYSENIGWISLNCLNDHDPNTPGIQTSKYNYGVDINWTTGQNVGFLSGWAWSPNVGWISFDRVVTGNPPMAPYNSNEPYIALIDKLAQSGESVKGWARAVSGCKNNYWDGTKCTSASAGDNSGGWDGWINLSAPTISGPKLVSSEFNKNDCTLNGWSWGDEVVGWLALNCDQTNYSSYGGSNTCSTSSFAFTITPADIYSGGAGRNFCGRPPIVSNPNILSQEFCETPVPGWDFNFTWTYFDPDGDQQKAVEIQTSSSNSEAGIIKTYGPYITSTNSRLVTLSASNYPGNSATYYYRIRVTDQSDAVSEWSSWATFVTPIHPYPKPDFTYLPLRPFPGETVSFTNNTQIFGGNPPIWDWNLGDGFTSDDENPIHSYSSAGSFDVKLTAIQDDLPAGKNSCYIIKTLPIKPRPGYRYEQTP